VILVSDIGGSSSPWPLVIWHLSPFVRIYIHDRAGFGKSEVNPLANNRRPKTYAEKAAEDLDKLLQKVGVEDPFILVPMFWGGGTCCQRILGAEERSRRWHGVDRMRPGKDE
jgi:pimeloyl-ACP methyl ester carboxylesterase